MLTDPIGWFGRRGIYYGWVIVAVTFVTLFVSTGFRFAFGVYYSAILDETGWGRAETASVVSAAMIVYACTACDASLGASGAGVSLSDHSSTLALRPRTSASPTCTRSSTWRVSRCLVVSAM